MLLQWFGKFKNKLQFIKQIRNKICFSYSTIINNKEDSILRATVSISYNLLNKYVVEGFISQYRTGEIKSALEHIKNDKNITTNYNSIYIMDRGYVSIELMLYCMMNNIKFLIRLDGTAYKNERSGITTNDESSPQ